MNVRKIKCGSSIVVTTVHSPSATKQTKWSAIPRDPHPDFLGLIENMEAHFIRKVVCRNETDVEHFMSHMTKLSNGMTLDNIALKEKEDHEILELRGKNQDGDSFVVNIMINAGIYPAEDEVVDIWEKLQQEALLFINEQKYDPATAEEGSPTLFETAMAE